MIRFAKFIVTVGALICFCSILFGVYLKKGEPEYYMNVINVILGVTMLLTSGFYLKYNHHKQNKRRK